MSTPFRGIETKNGRTYTIAEDSLDDVAEAIDDLLVTISNAKVLVRDTDPSRKLTAQRAAVVVPIEVDHARIKAGDLTVVKAQVETALSAPVHLTLGATRWNLRPARIARILELPADGRRDLRIGGSAATKWFGALARRVDRPPVNADWAIGSNSSVRVIPDQPGQELDVER